MVAIAALFAFLQANLTGCRPCALPTVAAANKRCPLYLICHATCACHTMALSCQGPAVTLVV